MKNFNNKKGQAAMEFLMTYGWAILAAVIVIGALGSYFYFNQSGTTTIFIGAPFTGVTAQVGVNQILIDMKKSGSVDMTNVTVNVDAYGCAENTTGFDGDSNDIQLVTLACTLPSGTNVAGDIIVTYLKPGANIREQISGSISGQVA